MDVDDHKERRVVKLCHDVLVEQESQVRIRKDEV